MPFCSNNQWVYYLVFQMDQATQFKCIPPQEAR